MAANNLHFIIEEAVRIPDNATAVLNSFVNFLSHSLKEDIPITRPPPHIFQLIISFQQFYLLGYYAVEIHGKFQTKSQRLGHKRNHNEAVSKQGYCLHASRWFPAWLIFDPKDGGDMFLRNVGWLQTDY
jgi:hypothetical protein